MRFLAFPVDLIRFREVLDSKRERLCSDEMYSVLRRKLTPEVTEVGLPNVARGRRRALSRG